MRRVLAWRERTLTDARRDCLATWALRSALVIMLAGWVANSVNGQSQDSINATLAERVRAAEQRIDQTERHLEAIDTKMWYGLAGIFSILVTNLLQMGKAKR
jgi:hypothetical protein